MTINEHPTACQAFSRQFLSCFLLSISFAMMED